MASSDPDITWLTYDEAGHALGIKADSVRRRAAARRWPRRLGNDHLARVGVPSELIRDVTPDSLPEIPPAFSPAVTPDIRDETMEVLRKERDQARLEAATLRIELVQAHERLTQSHERLTETAVHLNQRLADAQKEREREVAQFREDRDQWRRLAERFSEPRPGLLENLFRSLGLRRA